MNREKNIIRVSLVGIAVNVLLVVVKALIGLATNSIAIILDAVNNFGDALTSILTIIGTKLSNKKPDSKHPYGYGRIEYITSAIIAVIIMVAGVTSLKEAVVAIIHPVEASYSQVSIYIIIIALLAKIAIGLFFKSAGRANNANALIASGQEAMFDAIVSAGTLVAALVNSLFKVGIEPYIGAIISIIIIKSGIELILENFNNIIGIRADEGLTKELKQKIASYNRVNGAYDLVLHNYGPTETIGTVHIEVDDEMNANEIHHLTRVIMEDIYREYGIIMTIGIYASNTTDSQVVGMKKEVADIIKDYANVLTFHAFYVDKDRKTMTFDIVVSFDEEDPILLKKEIEQKLGTIYEGYSIFISVDTDFSD